MKIRKTVIAIVLILITACLLVGCNKQIVDLTYKFDRAYCKVGDEWIDIPIKKWKDYQDGEQLQLTLEDGSVLLVSSFYCILYKGELPEKEEE